MSPVPVPSDLPVELRTEALESILVEKGLVDPAVLDKFVNTYAEDVGPLNGAKVVAKAWTDPEYKARLLEDGTAAIAELGFKGPQGECIVVLENTPTLHHLVVCTLCSCYPWPVLGLPPGCKMNSREQRMSSGIAKEPTVAQKTPLDRARSTGCALTRLRHCVHYTEPVSSAL